MALPHVMSNVYMNNPHAFKRFHIIDKHEAPMYKLDLFSLQTQAKKLILVQDLY